MPDTKQNKILRTREAACFQDIPQTRLVLTQTTQRQRPESRAAKKSAPKTSNSATTTLEAGGSRGLGRVKGSGWLGLAEVPANTCNNYRFPSKLFTVPRYGSNPPNRAGPGTEPNRSVGVSTRRFRTGRTQTYAKQGNRTQPQHINTMARSDPNQSKKFSAEPNQNASTNKMPFRST